MIIPSLFRRSFFSVLSLVFLALMLQSCGGGGGGSETTASQANPAQAVGPTANPGSGSTGAPSSGEVIFDTVFSPDSFWYRPIPANAPLHANSANFVEELLRQKRTYYGTVTINMESYSSPVYIAEASASTTNGTPQARERT